MRADEIVIVPPSDKPNNVKGDFFEELLGKVMRAQRYEIIERINFTGTEIDLLCRHLDRPNDTALLECKARKSIASADLKTFAYDVLTGRAKVGFLVHTNPLQHQAAGMAREWEEQGRDNLVIWGPGKTAHLLVDASYILPPNEIGTGPDMEVTKRILLFTEVGRYWVHLLASGNVPTHYAVYDAATGNAVEEDIARRAAEGIEDIGSKLLPVGLGSASQAAQIGLPREPVAEIQGMGQWDDYRPASGRYFVGRSGIRAELDRFIGSVLTGTADRRVFFVEGRSGWGKSSVIADLRARAARSRHPQQWFCFAVDSRSAASLAFPALAFARMVEKAATDGFIPKRLAGVTISSPMDILHSQRVRELLAWLHANRKVLVLVFDQFEDIFRRGDLFRPFYHLMIGVSEERANLVAGFSWKTDVNIPIDNPAYHNWQVARSLAQEFAVQEFGGAEVNAIIRQLEAEANVRLPVDLRRRLVEVSQGFPWLIKKLTIHCYRQFQKGLTPEQLVDQDLNAELLFREDMDGLDADRARALKFIARRAFEGDPFDVTEIDDKINEGVVNSLLSDRLVIKSGGKYNVYWDIFQEYLVSGEVPKLGESFLLRQYPRPCLEVFQEVTTLGRASLAKLEEAVPRLSEGTILNRLRELRLLGLVVRDGEAYVPRPMFRSGSDAAAHVASRLDAHVVISDLRKSGLEEISHAAVRDALQSRYPTYSFSAKTWGMYASYLMGWMRFTRTDLGGRLADARGGGTTLESFTPQLRAEKVVEEFLAATFADGAERRSSAVNKLVYDLKALGLVTCTPETMYLTKRGKACHDLPREAAAEEIAIRAASTMKAKRAAEIVLESPGLTRAQFAEKIAPLLAGINSRVYRNKTITVLRSWADLVARHPRALGRQV